VGAMPKVLKAKSWRQLPALLKQIQASKS
jgi:hypothetical protein